LSAAGDAARLRRQRHGATETAAVGEADALHTPSTPRTDPWAGLVFALVVLATFAALGVTQWLKHAPTAVQQLEISPASFTPGAAGEAGVERFQFHIKRSDRITVGVIDSRGDTVRTVVRHRWLRGYKTIVLYWKGLEARGRRAPPGTYRLRVYLERQKREVLSPVSFELVRA
jgi:hypothetical protein